MSCKTNWAFHRANYANHFSELTIKEYASEYCLNYNTARVRLAGALKDDECLFFDFTSLNMRTGEPMPPESNTKPKVARDDRISDRKGSARSGGRLLKNHSRANRLDLIGNYDEKTKEKSTKYKRGSQRGKSTEDRPTEKKGQFLKSDRSGEKQRVVEAFSFPELGDSWAKYNAGGYVSWPKLSPEIQSEARAQSKGNVLLQLRIGRLEQMYKEQADMRAYIDALYADGGSLYMADGSPMPKEMAMSQASFGPSQRMTELENGIARMQELAANQHPLTKTEQIAIQKAVLKKRSEEDLTALETARMLEAEGVDVPKALLAEVQRELAMMEPEVETGGGYTPEQLEAEAQAGRLKNREWIEKGLPQRKAEIEAMIAEELASQNRSLMDEDDFAAEMAGLNGELTAAEQADGEPMNDEDVVEEW